MTRKELAEKICNENWISDDCCNAFTDGWEEADKHPQNPWLKVADKKPPIVEEIPNGKTITKAKQCIVCANLSYFIGYAAYNYIDESNGNSTIVYEEDGETPSLAWYDEYGDFIDEIGINDYYFPLPKLPEGGTE